MSENIPGKFATGILKSTLKTFLSYRSDIEVEINETENLKPPYIIVSNHVNNWDPILINLFIDPVISYVASDRFFRNPFLKKVLEYTGAIPKTKFMADISTVKKIIKAKRNKRVIGIFPEGNRNWDGTTGEILFSTAKLIKMLKIPVVAVNLKGFHLSQPRWANNHRRGKVLISFKKIMDKDVILSSSEEEIYGNLVKGLYHDEYEFQRNNRFKYSGKNLAENLELLLFTCPHCKKIDTLKSKANEFYCKECGYKMTYSQKGFFDSNSHSLVFDNPRDWNKWQLDNLESILISDDDPFSVKLSNKDASLYKFDNKKLKLLHEGDLSLDSKAMHFLNKHYDNTLFMIDKIQGLNVQSNNKIEFYYNNILYRIGFNQRLTSAYKWMKALEISKANILSNNLKEKGKVAYE
ncbi:lysophospholipid acyltransferase family protein [Sporosalibacterium faouarense]|uniref:lysophospholipid acyltransferase family protein n=1 Tax=Sporosalibacterium faouarense TaxID=516123 RepID=UPI00141CCB99|nr:lysophospholipid acyltransferase family protein [Sporosalibacterium faouarense]MTI46623.1 1-acyl-sn-glycerol-3-phosphate acyltransferase [Bacillota bacterium]